MLRSYLTVTLRNLSRHRLHSAISVFSLAVGMAAGIIALVFIQHEVSFDRFHDDVGRLFRVLRQRGEGDRLNVRWTTSGALARALESDFPQIEAASRSRMYHVNVRVDEQTFTLRQTHVDEQFLTLFEFPFVRGSRADLSEPYSIAITRSTAKLCFGERDPIGQLVTIEERYYGGDYTVTGIIEDPPPNSSLQFDLIHQTEPRDAEGLRDWQDWRPRVQQAQIQTFVRLSAGVAAADMERSLSAAIGRYMGAEAQQNISYRLQPLLRQHLYSHQDYGLAGDGDINQVITFGAVAGFILLIACVNFTNLATARSMSRAREVGLRKVVGARRLQVVVQFLGESAVLAAIALILSLAVVWLLLPHFNRLAGTALQLTAATMAAILPGILLLVVFVALLAGAYPAFFLSAFEPIDSFRQARRGGATRFRHALVVTQFAVSIALVIGTGMIYRQIEYIGERHLGFDKEHFLILPIFQLDRESKAEGEEWLVGRYDVVKTEFTRHPNILTASAFRFLPGQDVPMTRRVTPEGHEGTEWLMPVQECDESFMDAFGIPLLAGRTFSPDIERDRTHGWILNETAVGALGWTPQNAVGRRFGRARSEEDAKGEVIGVVGDFHYQSLHSELQPAALGYRPWFYSYLGLRIDGRDLPETMAFVERTWRRFMPEDKAPVIQFLDDRLDRLYETDRRLARTGGAFSVLAIVLGCLGLFGLASFSAEQRVREVGIRKTLGASSTSLLLLLSRDTVRLVLVGGLLAWVGAWFLVDRWLEEYAYRTTLDPAIFIGAGVGALVVALLTVSFHAVRAAQSDPTVTLRAE
ncbi:MAG TPA: FtsX-like permease family protein [Candidatus Latescibacteria bacterium]|jgi:putative ABC transport system permease protein|nr:hypothetical protein [Gemmatimonadaceae bacterium]MDP6014833.1 ABC transporter permease [Candidatus Latescibacterota bacterium]HJP34195.1 FtsX-like permease family protein [Candidatus Latescibacterota bacterium]